MDTDLTISGLLDVRRVLGLLRGLLFPSHTMAFTHSPLWGGLLLTSFSLCYLFRVPVPLLLSLPRWLSLREMS